MAQIHNGGIIIYRESKMKQLLSLLAAPRLEADVIIHDEGQDIHVFIFDCPVNKERLDKRSYRQLKELVDKNRAKFLVEHFDYKVQSNVPIRKNELHYTQLLPQVQGMKQLAVLIKLSQERDQNLLEGNVGFIMGDVDSGKIDVLSEEAANVMIYESKNLTEQHKTKLHNEFMEKKGISLVFTKDIEHIIQSSSILSIDDEVDLEGFEHLLEDKIILGCSKSDKVKTINNILLWNKEIQELGSDSPVILYNNEMITIMRYYYSKLDIIDFIRKLPYISF